MGHAALAGLGFTQHRLAVLLDRGVRTVISTAAIVPELRVRLTRGALTLILCLVAALGTRGLASEQSERAYSRGLVEFDAGHYRAALRFFDQAVRADPADAYARFYRGVAYGRLSEYAAAAHDLEAALALRPDLPQAPLELGVALVQRGAYARALPWLQRAQHEPATASQAALFLGIAYLRLGQTAAARPALAQAAQDPRLHTAARYYLGVTDFRDQQWAAARAAFTAVARMSPASAFGREAAAFLARMREHGVYRNYAVFATLGLQYDSNVLLAPSNEALKSTLGISTQADGRAVIEAGGVYVPWRTPQAQLALGYDFFQSLHFDLTEFNLQDHRPSIELTARQGMLHFGLLGRYDYYLRQTDSFLQEGTAVPWVAIDDGNAGRTELFYRLRRRDFLQQPFSGVLDSFNHAAGMRQYVYLDGPQRYLALGYRFDVEDPINAQGDQFGYDGNEVNGGIGWIFPARISAEAESAYRHESYDAASALPAGSNQRRDDVYEVVVAVHRQLGPYLRLTAAYLGTFNNSNKVEFEYNRQIGSIALEAQF